MADRVNRRERILDTAARLFVDQGYTATSVRQIAVEVGCTEAALYYHFKEGNRALLGAVLEKNMPNLLGVVNQCRDAASLHDLIVCFGLGMVAEAQHLSANRLRWVIAEFPKFSEDERKIIHERVVAFQKDFAILIRKFITDEAEAQQLSWMITFIMFGYGQMMINMDLQSVFDFDVKAFVECAAATLAARH